MIKDNNINIRGEWNLYAEYILGSPYAARTLGRLRPWALVMVFTKIRGMYE